MPGICPPYGIELLVGRSVDLELIPQPLGPAVERQSESSNRDLRCAAPAMRNARGPDVVTGLLVEILAFEEPDRQSGRRAG
jgi:hypothetical protein